MGRWVRRAICGAPTRAARPGLCAGPASGQEAAPEAPGAPTRPDPGPVGPSGAAVTAGGAGHASPVSPDSGAPARFTAPRLGAGYPGGGPGGRAQSGVAERGGARGLQDARVTFGALVAPRAAEEGWRGSETPVRPEAAAAPAS